MKLPNGNGHQFLKTRGRDMQERADELDLYSSSTTVFTSQARWRWMNTSTARQECATLSLYTTSRTTDRYRTDAVVCWLPKFLGSKLAPPFH